MQAEVISVNVGLAAPFAMPGGMSRSAIVKRPVFGRAAVSGVTIEGDEQADRVHHGGEDQALYAYAIEDYAWWEKEIRRSLEPGTFGENLTTRGIDVNAALAGERWRVGIDLVVEVTVPRIPCATLAARMDDPTFVKRFGSALRPGAYLRIVNEGTVGAGDEISVLAKPSHGLSIAEFTRIYLFEHHRAAELLAIDRLGPSWSKWVHERVA